MHGAVEPAQPVQWRREAGPANPKRVGAELPGQRYPVRIQLLTGLKQDVFGIYSAPNGGGSPDLERYDAEMPEPKGDVPITHPKSVILGRVLGLPDSPRARAIGVITTTGPQKLQPGLDASSPRSLDDNLLTPASNHGREEDEAREFNNNDSDNGEQQPWQQRRRYQMRTTWGLRARRHGDCDHDGMATASTTTRLLHTANTNTVNTTTRTWRPGRRPPAPRHGDLELTIRRLPEHGDLKPAPRTPLTPPSTEDYKCIRRGHVLRKSPPQALAALPVKEDRSPEPFLLDVFLSHAGILVVLLQSFYESLVLRHMLVAMDPLDEALKPPPDETEDRHGPRGMATSSAARCPDARPDARLSSNCCRIHTQT
ncbi:hypothetical protein BDZ89DRAFT_1046522 [Hymenopellis radicata]|nr:hypothetical protein BDZ89DRAFT_1046522 [Hymenopellis radicata]